MKREKRNSIPVGTVFGKWTVIGGPFRVTGTTKFFCRCVCGAEKRILMTYFRNGYEPICKECKLPSQKREQL